VLTEVVGTFVLSWLESAPLHAEFKQNLLKSHKEKTLNYKTKYSI